jgi:hypothetical protein
MISKLKLSFTILFIVTIVIIFVYQYENLSNYNHYTIKKLKYISNYDSVNYNEINKLKKRVYYKPNNIYWEKLEPLIFFKLSLGYYFIDKQYGRVLFLTHEQNKLNFTVRLYIYKKDYLILKNQIETPRIEMEIYKKMHARIYSLYLDFKLEKSFESERMNFNNNPNDYKMEIFIRNNINNQTTQSPIELKIKNLRKIKNDPQVEYAMICSKCFQYNDDTPANTYKWWFELHKQIGYSKVRFCNNSIPNTPAYNDVFYE